MAQLLLVSFALWTNIYASVSSANSNFSDILKNDRCFILTIDVPDDVEPKLSRLRLCYDPPKSERQNFQIKIIQLDDKDNIFKEEVFTGNLTEVTKEKEAYYMSPKEGDNKRSFVFTPPANIFEGDSRTYFLPNLSCITYKSCGKLHLKKDSETSGGRFRYYQIN